MVVRDQSGYKYVERKQQQVKREGSFGDEPYGAHQRVSGVIWKRLDQNRILINRKVQKIPKEVDRSQSSTQG